MSSAEGFLLKYSSIFWPEQSKIGLRSCKSIQNNGSVRPYNRVISGEPNHHSGRPINGNPVPRADRTHDNDLARNELDALIRR